MRSQHWTSRSQFKAWSGILEQISDPENSRWLHSTGGRWAKCRCLCNGHSRLLLTHSPASLTPPPPLTPRGPHYLTLVNRSQNRVIDLVQIFWLSGGRSSWEWAPITLIWKGHSLLLFTQPCLSWTLLSNVLRFEPNWGYIFGRRFYGVLTSDYQCIAWHCCNILGGFNKHLSRLSRLSYTPKPSSWLR